jgi:hypothetical protein
MDKGIIWLSSYPKSGNTWMRILLSNYNSRGTEPVSINAINTDGIASSRPLFDQMVGVDSTSLTFEEIDALRPEVYEKIAETTERLQYIKVHDAYTLLPDGRPLLPSLNSKVVYIVRNPLDIVPSLANHMGTALDETVRFMCDEKSCFSSSKRHFTNQLRQQLLSWEGHVSSFLEQDAMEVLLVRYEDMQTDTVSEFQRVLDFCGVKVDSQRLKKAVDFSDFKQLKKQEEQDGFKERSPKSPQFFNSGKVGNWKDKLTEQQIEQIISINGEMMKKLGYL